MTSTIGMPAADTPRAFLDEEDAGDDRDLEDARRHAEALRRLAAAIAPPADDYDDCYGD
jgi:hypothetical protein